MLAALISSDPAPSTPRANWLVSILMFFLFASPFSDIYMFKDRHRSGALAILSLFTCGTAGIISQYFTSENLKDNEYPHHSGKPLQTWKKKQQPPKRTTPSNATKAHKFPKRTTPTFATKVQKLNKKKIVGLLTATAVLTGLYFIGSAETEKSVTQTPVSAPDTTVQIIQVALTTTSTPASPKDALTSMVKGMKLKSTPTISTSKCGQFTYLVKSDGSHQFYRWNGTQWTVDKSGENTSSFANDFIKVKMVDATGDKIDDFIITLPTWDPLKSDPKPLAGAVFASINCKWDWRTFKTTYGGSYYQLDNLFWDSSSKKIVAGDEVTNMDAANYDGNRRTKQRFFVFNSKSKEFILASGTPPKNPTPETTPSTEPLFKPPAIALEEAAFQCDTELFDLLDNYNITNIDPQNIGRIWFNNSDYKFRVGKTPVEISKPIISACATVAKKRIAQVTQAAENSCWFSRKELAEAYGVPTSSSRSKVAAAVAKDFLPRFKSLVIASCLRKMK